MRKLLTAALALVAALAFLVVGSPPASAFGSEVLGCSIDYGWSAPTCYSTGAHAYNTIEIVNFELHNTSGTYSTSWTITTNTGATVTKKCDSTLTTPCLITTGCTAGSLSCQVEQRTGFTDRTVTAALTLTQSGQTRTVTAVGTLYEAL